MLTIADEGGRVGEKFNEMGFKVPKMCVKETNAANIVSCMLFHHKEPKGLCNMISKRVFSLHSLLEGGSSKC